ncbi:FtsB family cell division protein [Bacillus kexueae]|uniref:FtsB family cell division protein n=1 Tax=Aeribacillus kexueae TaxID=2078952 RepID=UPI001FAED2E4|nr:septum formation initiator family protein [Bacillus kexueae]
MAAERKQKIARIQSDYVIQHEKQEHMKKRRKKGLIRRLTVLIIVMLASVAIISTKIISQASAIQEKMEEKERLEKELSTLEQEQKKIENEIKKLNDDEYIAKLARRDYFLSDEGEIIFNIPDGTE